jgi:hypothetical protein
MIPDTNSCGRGAILDLIGLDATNDDNNNNNNKSNMDKYQRDGVGTALNYRCKLLD